MRLATPTRFTESMSLLASGVVMVTTRLDGRPWGVTVSSFTSVSADPPTALVSLATDTAAARMIESAESFGVSLLGPQHRAAACHGSRRGQAKFLERFVDRHARGANPVIAGALAHFDCDVTEQLEVADHTIFVSLVREAHVGACGEPLVYFRRGYQRLARDGSARRVDPCFAS